MGNEMASRIMAQTSQSLNQLSGTMMDLAAKKEEATRQMEAVRLNKINRLFETALKTPSTTAQKVIYAKLTGLVNEEFGTEFEEGTFRAIAPELYRKTKAYWNAEPGSDEERALEGEVSDLAGLSDDPQASVKYMSGVKGKKAGMLKLFGNPYEAGEMAWEGGEALKGRGYKPTTTAEGEEDWVTPPVSPEMAQEVGGVFRDTMKALIEDARKEGLSLEKAERLGQRATETFQRLFPGMAGAFGQLQGASGPTPPPMAPPPPAAAEPPSEGMLPQEGEGAAPEGLPRALGKISEKEQDAINTMVGLSKMSQTLTRDYVALSTLSPKEMNDPLTGYLASKAGTGSIPEILHGYALYLATGKRLPTPMAEALNGLSQNSAKIIAKSLEGAARGLTDFDARLAQKMTLKLGMGKAALGSLYAGSVYSANAMEALITTLKSRNISEMEMKPLVDAYAEHKAYMETMRELAIAVGAPAMMRDEDIRGIAARIWPDVKRAMAEGKLPAKATPADLIRMNPNSAVVLKTLSELTDKNGNTPLMYKLDQALGELAAQERAGRKGAR